MTQTTDQERAEFEAFARSQWRGINLAWLINFSKYADFDTNTKWITWQAARRMQHLPELATKAAPVQMPEPVAVAFRFETEEYGSTAISFYPSDRIGMGWTALYTEHQVRQLLAHHGIK